MEATRRFRGDVFARVKRKEKIGFCCFSISGTVNKLWNEYARSDNGDPRGGICIQIVAPKTACIKGLSGALVERVSYIENAEDVVISAHLCNRIWNEKPSMDLANAVHSHIIRKLTTKSLTWEEEQECRAFVADEDGSGMASLNPDLMRVTGLILGENCRLAPDEVDRLTCLYDKTSLCQRTV